MIRGAPDRHTSDGGLASGAPAGSFLLDMSTNAASSRLPAFDLVPRARLWQRRKVVQTKGRLRVILKAESRRHEGVRRRLAAQYLTGSGLEIGALHLALRVPASATVRYVDRFGIDELRERYAKYDPNFNLYPIAAPDIVDDGEALVTVPDSSVDFVVANHFIEHCEDPIGTLKTFLRVLRPGGVIYMAVPDCRFTFDRDRPVTTLDHIVRDHREGPEWSRQRHYEEYAQLVEGVPESHIVDRADEMQRDQFTIHFHVWNPSRFLDLLATCRNELDLPLELDALERNDHEFIVIMRRSAR